MLIVGDADSGGRGTLHMYQGRRYMGNLSLLSTWLCYELKTSKWRGGGGELEIASHETRDVLGKAEW